MKNFKYYIIISLVISFVLFSSCEKEPVVTENTYKTENVLKSDTRTADRYPYITNRENPYEYTGVWHLEILRRTDWYFVTSPAYSIYADYDFSKRACMDILGRRVYTNELLALGDINTIIQDLGFRYSNVIANSGLTDNNKARLQTLINDIYNVLKSEMPVEDYYKAIIKVITSFEATLPIPLVTQRESIQAHENRILLIICSIARHSLYYWFNKIQLENAQSAINAANYSLAAIAGAIATCRQTGMMTFDVRITCSASMTSAVAGF